MAQLTVYVDDNTLKKIEMAAKRERTSISKWVKIHLVFALQTNWPSNYFDLFGSLADEKLQRPPQGSFSQDARREVL